ncbi:MAG: GerMN domain-containing protein [Dethiobacteria bacterium]
MAEANYGSGTEAVLLSSIVWTLTQLEEIEAVQILVEGEIVDSLGGHCSASIPLTR